MQKPTTEINFGVHLILMKKKYIKYLQKKIIKEGQNIDNTEN